MSETLLSLTFYLKEKLEVSSCNVGRMDFSACSLAIGLLELFLFVYDAAMRWFCDLMEYLTLFFIDKYEDDF